MFPKGVRDAELDRYAGGAFPFPAMRSGTMEHQAECSGLKRQADGQSTSQR
jgi:hypothetical protein